MSPLGKKQQQEVKARQRAEIIMKVRSGVMTATEGAAELGVSRKTYYKWENRALGAMLDGLEDRDTGRPESPQSHKEDELRKELGTLQQQKELLEKRLEITNMLHTLELEKALERTAKSRKNAVKKKKKRTGKS